jgi:hypothetical protein
MGPFEVVVKKGPMAFQLSFPDSLRCMHDVFHVSILRHYVSDPTHVIDMSSLEVSADTALMKEPIYIQDHHIQQLWCRTIDQVKDEWEIYSPHSPT